MTQEFFEARGYQIPDGWMLNGYDFQVTNAPIGEKPKGVIFTLDFEEKRIAKEKSDAESIKRLKQEFPFLEDIL